MKITIKELRNGMTIYKDQQVMQVIEYRNMTDFYRLKVMNFTTYNRQELDIPVTETIETITPKIINAELNDIDGDTYLFFDTDTYDFLEVHKNAINNPKWIFETVACTLYSYNGIVYRVDPVRFIKAKVKKIEPGFRPIAVLENGTKIEVNSSVFAGDIITIDTATDQYLPY